MEGASLHGFTPSQLDSLAYKVVFTDAFSKWQRHVLCVLLRRYLCQLLEWKFVNAIPIQYTELSKVIVNPWKPILRITIIIIIIMISVFLSAHINTVYNFDWFCGYCNTYNLLIDYRLLNFDVFRYAYTAPHFVLLGGRGEGISCTPDPICNLWC